VEPQGWRLDELRALFARVGVTGNHLGRKHARDVGLWPHPDVPLTAKRVRLLGQSRQHLLTARLTAPDPFRTHHSFEGARCEASNRDPAVSQTTAPCGWVPYVPLLRATVDPQCQRRVTYIARGDGPNFSRSREFVLTGEPVAVMRGGAQLAALLATGSSQLYIEFRKDGQPIDPSPWWAASEIEKVRG